MGARERARGAVGRGAGAGARRTADVSRRGGLGKLELVSEGGLDGEERTQAEQALALRDGAARRRRLGQQPAAREQRRLHARHRHAAVGAEVQQRRAAEARRDVRRQRLRRGRLGRCARAAWGPFSFSWKGGVGCRNWDYCFFLNYFL